MKEDSRRNARRSRFNSRPMSASMLSAAWHDRECLQNQFDELDQNRDGKINFDELSQILSLLPSVASNSTDEYAFDVLGELFLKYDVERRNDIDFEQFCCILSEFNQLKWY